MERCCPSLTCATGQVQSLPLAALASLLRLNQVQEGIYRCTEAWEKKGEDGEGEAVKQSSQHSIAQALQTSRTQSCESTTPEGLHPAWPGAQTLHLSLILYLSVPDYGSLLEQSRDVWESSQGLPGAAPSGEPSHKLTLIQDGGRGELLLLQAQLGSPLTSASEQHTAQILVLLGVWGPDNNNNNMMTGHRAQ